MVMWENGKLSISKDQGWPTCGSQDACGSLPRFMPLFLTCFVSFTAYQQGSSVIMLHLATSKVHYHVIITFFGE